MPFKEAPKGCTNYGWPVGPTLKKCGGTGQCPFKEAPKGCTNYGWPVGPTVKK